MPERLAQDEINDKLVEYEGWEQQGGFLMKRFEFDDFSAALDFLNDVGAIAEDLNHHPNMMLQDYNEVILEITTHDAGGITQNDFNFVGRVEAITDA